VSAAAFLACVLIGFVAGVINVLAAGGSFLTLPLLLFLGLPASDANGTNRVGIVTQNITATLGFHRHRVLDWRWALAVSAPALIGAGIGVWAALNVPEIAFRRILSFAMLSVTLWTLLRGSTSSTSGSAARSPWHWTMILGFFVVGLYGGFLQAGVGFLTLAITSVAGLDLVRGNAIKVFTMSLLTLLSVAIFAGTGNVDWPVGLALALGNLVGGLVGVRVAVLRGHKWLEGVVTATVILFAVMLWITDPEVTG
jgi:uncharacterized membrane protein YfcA